MGLAIGRSTMKVDRYMVDRGIAAREPERGQRERDGGCLFGGHAHSGILPCLRAGRPTRLVRSMRSAPISTGRVRAGSMTSSR